MTKEKPSVDNQADPTTQAGAEATVPTAAEKVFPVEETEAPSLGAEAAIAVADLPAPAAAAIAVEILPPAAEPEPLARGEALVFSWSDRSLEFWQENAEALYRLAGDLGAARTPVDILEAQTKFALERLRALGRHAEAMTTVRVGFFRAA
jgi:hypothetical protein